MSVSLTDETGVFNAKTGALFLGSVGLLSHAQGATYTFQYASQVVDGACRDLFRSPVPQSDSADWFQPKTYFGPDYAVVVWSGKRVPPMQR